MTDGAGCSFLLCCFCSYSCSCLLLMRSTCTLAMDLEGMHTVTVQHMTPDVAWHGKFAVANMELALLRRQKVMVFVMASGSSSDQATSADLCTTLARASTTCPLSSRSNRTKSACLHHNQDIIIIIYSWSPWGQHEPTDYQHHNSEVLGYMCLQLAATI